MKKLIVIIMALACALTLGAKTARAQGGDLYVDGSVTPVIVPLDDGSGDFKVSFFGVLTSYGFDGYPDIDCDDCSFTIVAKDSDGEMQDRTTGFSVASGGIFDGTWGPIAQSEASNDMTFKVRFTGSFYHDDDAVLDSEEFSICDIAGAKNIIGICKSGIGQFVVKPIPLAADLCPGDPDKTLPGLCGCGEVDIDDNANGICDADESEDVTAVDDADGDGWTDDDELLCGSDPDDASIIPDDNDQDGICNEQDVDNDNDGWTDIEEDDCITDPLDANDIPLDDDGDGICNLLDDDFSSSTNSTDDDDAAAADASADEFGGGSCSLNPSATADFSTLFLLALLCLATPVAVTLHIRKRR